MLYPTLKRVDDTERFHHGNLKVCQTKKLTTPTSNDSGLSISIKWYGNSIFCILSKGRCLKQTKKNETYTPPKIIFFLLSVNKINGHEIWILILLLRAPYLEVLN